MKNVDYMKLVHNFHMEMIDYKFTLVYEGEITHQITKAFTSLAENKMDSYSEETPMKRKVFHVMVECLQNLSKHAEELDSSSYGTTGSNNGIFIVGRLGDDNQDYHVMTGNAVDNQKVPELKALLEKINQLDKDGLKELFKKKMREGSLSEKGGAGLGLIDIARKTGEKLEYQFEQIDNKTSFFLLRTIISRSR